MIPTPILLPASSADLKSGTVGRGLAEVHAGTVSNGPYAIVPRYRGVARLHGALQNDEAQNKN